MEDCQFGTEVELIVRGKSWGANLGWQGGWHGCHMSSANPDSSDIVPPSIRPIEGDEVCMNS
jgi:hypothetical protein